MKEELKKVFWQVYYYLEDQYHVKKRKFKRIKREIRKNFNKLRQKTVELVKKPLNYNILDFITEVLVYGTTSNYVLWVFFGKTLSIWTVLGYGILYQYLFFELPEFFRRNVKGLKGDKP